MRYVNVSASNHQQGAAPDPFVGGPHLHFRRQTISARDFAKLHDEFQWSTRQSSGSANDFLVVPHNDGRIRISSGGLRVLLDEPTALNLCNLVADVIQARRHPHAHTFAEQLAQAIGEAPDSDFRPPLQSDHAIRDAIHDELEDIHVELAEARIAAAAGDLVAVRAWLDLSEKVIGGRLTELKQQRLQDAGA